MTLIISEMTQLEVAKVCVGFHPWINQWAFFFGADDQTKQGIQRWDLQFIIFTTVLHSIKKR